MRTQKMQKSFFKRFWDKFIWWFAGDYIRTAYIGGYRKAYNGAAMVVDLDCVSMNAFYEKKSKRDCFKDLKEHFEECAKTQIKVY